MSTPNQTINQECIDTCNKLLRGEISAVETYTKAIEKFGNEPEAVELHRIRDEHALSVEDLRENVVSMGGVPDTDSGAWGEFTKLLTSAASLLGENSGLTALRRGEEHGRREYESALEDETTMVRCKDLIRSRLLPRIDSHLMFHKRHSAA